LLVAMLSISAMTAFGSGIEGSSTKLESRSASALLQRTVELLGSQGRNSTVVVYFPASAFQITLNLSGTLLTMVAGNETAAANLDGLSGDFLVSLRGQVTFRSSGSILEASQDG